MYLRAAKTEAEDAGISTEGMADSVSQLRDELMALTGNKVDIMSDAEAGAYKSTVEILRELAAVWDDLSDTSRTNITELIGGGVRNANIISALMENFDIVDDAMKTSMESSGSALAENEKRLDSIVGKTAQFQAAFQDLSTTFFDSEMIKGFVDAGTSLLSGLNSVSKSFGPILLALAGGRVLDTITNLSRVFKESTKLKILKSVFDAFRGGELIGPFRDLPILFKTMFSDIKAGVPVLKALGTAFSNLGITPVLLVIGAAITAFQALKKAKEEAIQNAQAAAKAYNDEKKSLEEYKTEVDSLNKTVNDKDSTHEDVYEARKKLYEIQSELTKEFGSGAISDSGLDLLTQDANEAAEAFERLAAARANAYLAENGDNINTAIEKMNTEQEYIIGHFNWNEMTSEARAAVSEIVALNDNLQLTQGFVGGIGNTLKLVVKGTPEAVKTATSQFKSEYDGLGQYMLDQIKFLAGATGEVSIDQAVANITGIVGEVIDNYGNIATAGIDAYIQRTPEFKSAVQQMTAAQDEFAEATIGSSKNTEENIKTLQNAIETSNEALANFDNTNWTLEGGEAVRNSLLDEYERIQDQAAQMKFELRVALTVDGGSIKDSADTVLNRVQEYLDVFRDEEDGKIWASDILGSEAALTFDEWKDLPLDQIIAKGKEFTAFLSLFNTATRNGFSSVESMLSVFNNYGIVVGTMSEMIGDASKAFSRFTTESEAVNKVINEQKEGQSVSLEAYEGLIKISDEYADCLEYQGDTIQFNTEKLKELNDARNNEQYATIKANKANLQSQYNKNADEINNLTDALRNAAFARTEDGQAARDRLNQLMDENKELSINIDKLNLMTAAMREASSARSAWLNAQDDAQPGDSLNDAAGAIAHIWEVLNGSSPTRGDVGTSKYKTALDYVIPVDKINEGEAAIRKYLRSLQGILKMDGKGNVTDIRMDNIIKKLSQGKDAIIEKGDDGNWIVKAGKDIDDFAEKLGVTEELARSIIGMMNRNGANLNLDDRETESYIDKLKKAKEAKEKLADKDTSEGVDIKIDFSDVEKAEDKLDEIEKSLESAQNIVAKYGIDSSDGEAAADIIDYLLEQKKKLEYPVIMSIDSDQIQDRDVEKAVEEFQNLIDLQSEFEYATRTGDTAGAEEIKKDIEAAVEAIKDIDKEILDGFGFNIDELVDADSLEEAVSVIEDTLSNVSVPDLVSAFNIPESAFVGIQTAVQTLSDMSGTTKVDVDVKCDSTPLESALGYYNSLQDKTVIITVVTRYVGGGGGGSVGDGITEHAGGVLMTPNGTMANGTAHLSGTARVSGDWGTANAGRTLVGELGREIVVNPHTGRWYTVGDNGAEFVDMPGGAIVFNHLQTKHLLENGYVTGRGKAYASGTALAGATISGTIPSTGAWQTGGNSSSGSGNTIVNGDVVINSGIPIEDGFTTSAKSHSFEDMYNWHNHILEMEQETYKEYIEWLSKAYMDAYNRGEYEHDDFYKYEEEVFEGLKELFEDALSDMEFQIETLLRDEGNQQQVINMYNQMITSVNAEIEKARQRGLTDDDDYIQELLKHRHDYEDEIKDLQEDANKEAKSAVKDLVDYRIQMLKKYLEEEKDALDKKLDELKEFYDKQKEMLQDVRDEEKYLEEQSEKRKNRDDIDAELRRLEFDNSAWAQKRKLELQQQLSEAQKELDDFESDHTFDKTQELLDDLYERQEKQIESEIEAIEDKLNDPKALYNQALADIQNNTLALYEEMVEYNDKFGSGNAEDTKEKWNEAKESLDRYLATFGEAYKNIILTPLPDGYASGTISATPGVHSVDELGPEYVFTSSNGARYRVFSGGEKVLNARATNFLYNFANSGEKILSTIFEKIVGAHTASQISPTNHISEINMGDVIIQGNTNESTVSEIRRAKREEMQWILKEFNKMNKRS